MTSEEMLKDLKRKLEKNVKKIAKAHNLDFAISVIGGYVKRVAVNTEDKKSFITIGCNSLNFTSFEDCFMFSLSSKDVKSAHKIMQCLQKMKKIYIDMGYDMGDVKDD